MALLLAELENNPFEPVLDPQGPFLKYLSCLSEYAPNLPKKMKNAIKDPKKWKLLAHTLAAKDRIINSFLATTQAIDVINGGVKINALPEVVTGKLAVRTWLNAHLQPPSITESPCT
jgi:Gly-Xaa carboxypeptidase